MKWYETNHNMIVNPLYEYWDQALFIHYCDHIYKIVMETTSSNNLIELWNW